MVERLAIVDSSIAESVAGGKDDDLRVRGQNGTGAKQWCPARDNDGFQIARRTVDDDPCSCRWSVRISSWALERIDRLVMM